jgi:hypothetical protein
MNIIDEIRAFLYDLYGIDIADELDTAIDEAAHAMLPEPEENQVETLLWFAVAVLAVLVAVALVVREAGGLGA